MCAFGNVMLIITLVILSSAVGLQATDFNSSLTFKNIILKAESRTKYASSPGFPKAFPGNTNCRWIIFSDEVKRIRLEFKKLFLLEPVGETCVHHYVTVTSPFSLYSMGPYCGLQGVPTIVSTGNMLYVDLKTEVPVTSDNYQGFKFAFKLTEESSSYELRPDNSLGDMIMTIDPATLHLLSPPPKQPTVMSRSPMYTTKPPRFNPSSRPTTRRYASGNSKRTLSASKSNYPFQSHENLPSKDAGAPGRRFFDHDETPRPVRIEIIVGVIVSGLVILTLLVFIGLKTNQRAKFRAKNSNSQQLKISKDFNKQIKISGANKPKALPM